MPDKNSRFLAHQGLSCHGDGAEGSSNFNQLLHLRAFDDSNPDPIVLYVLIIIINE